MGEGGGRYGREGHTDIHPHVSPLIHPYISDVWMEGTRLKKKPKEDGVGEYGVDILKARGEDREKVQ